MRALARSHRQPVPENKTCRLFGAARDKHSMRAATTVNRRGEVRKRPVSRKDRIVLPM
jgi:hypothetical protein